MPHIVSAAPEDIGIAVAGATDAAREGVCVRSVSERSYRRRVQARQRVKGEGLKGILREPMMASINTLNPCLVSTIADAARQGKRKVMHTPPRVSDEQNYSMYSVSVRIVLTFVILPGLPRNGAPAVPEPLTRHVTNNTTRDTHHNIRGVLAQVFPDDRDRCLCYLQRWLNADHFQGPGEGRPEARDLEPRRDLWHRHWFARF